MKYIFPAGDHVHFLRQLSMCEDSCITKLQFMHYKITIRALPNYNLLSLKLSLKQCKQQLEVSNIEEIKKVAILIK